MLALVSNAPAQFMIFLARFCATMKLSCSHVGLYYTELDMQKCSLSIYNGEMYAHERGWQRCRRP